MTEAHGLEHPLLGRKKKNNCSVKFLKAISSFVLGHGKGDKQVDAAIAKAKVRVSVNML
jgi:hypothetical protein